MSTVVVRIVRQLQDMSHPGKRALSLAAFAVLLAAVAAGCGGSDSTSSSGSTSEDTSTTETQSSADSSGDAEGAKVALVMHFRGPFPEEIIQGSEDAAKDLNADLQIAGPQEFDSPAQVKAVQDAAASGAKGVATPSYPADLWIRPIEELADQGIPVVTLNNASPESESPLYVGASDPEVGAELANMVIDELGNNPEGTVVLGSCVPGVASLDERIVAIKKVFGERAPGVDVKGAYDTTGDPTKEFQIWSELVATNPDALAFLGVCGPDEEALAKIKSREPGAKYIVAAVDEAATTLKDIKDGVTLGTVGQNPYLQGYLAVYYLIQDVALGQSIPEGWINAETEVVTAANIDEALERHASLDATREHYKPIIEEILANPSPKPMSDLIAAEELAAEAE